MAVWALLAMEEKNEDMVVDERRCVFLRVQLRGIPSRGYTGLD